MQPDEILSSAFTARIKAVEALIRAAPDRSCNVDELRSTASELDAVTTLYGDVAVAGVYAAFADLVRIVATLLDWRRAVLTSETEASRFLVGAKEQHRLWTEQYASSNLASGLRKAVERLPEISLIQDVQAICRNLAATPLPIGIFAEQQRGLRIPQYDEGEPEETPRPVELSIAFLEFLIDGTPASAVNDMTPRESHDLDIEVRVSRWPASAEALELLPVTIERSSTADFPTFRFGRPSGEPPYRLRQTQRAVLKVAQGLQARPFDFNYTAQFVPQSAEQPVAVVGMRNLRIEGFDIGKAPLTGFPEIDRKLRNIRNELRRQPLISQADLGHTLSILRVLSALGGRVTRDNVFPGIWSEKKFQDEVRAELRRDPEIAAGLEEHPHVGGGVTDLSFHQIRIELKSEPAAKLTLGDCERFIGQAASYIASSGKRIGILCVLDCSPKSAAPFPPDEGIGVLKVKTPEGELCVGTVLIQGNLARPSDLSR